MTASGDAPTRRLLGDGYEPHVDEIDGRLVYSIPVECGVVGLMFEFEIDRSDLAAMLEQPYRRTVLRWVLHTILQHSALRGNAKVTQGDFRGTAARVLFAPLADVSRLIEAVNARHNIRLQYFIDQDMQRLGDASA